MEGEEMHEEEKDERGEIQKEIKKRKK